MPSPSGSLFPLTVAASDVRYRVAAVYHLWRPKPTL